MRPELLLVRVVTLGDERSGGDHAGVIDQNVDAAELRERVRNDRRCIARIAHIRCAGCDDAAALTNFTCERCKRIGPAADRKECVPRL